MLSLLLLLALIYCAWICVQYDRFLSMSFNPFNYTETFHNFAEKICRIISQYLMDNDIQICSVKMKYYVRFVMDKKNLSYERTLHWNWLKTIYQLLSISAIWLPRFINTIGHLKIWMHASTMFNQQMARCNKSS